MYKEQIKDVLRGVQRGKITLDEAMENLKDLPFEDLGFAKIDHHRSLRRGFPEVVFCQNKTTKQVVEIVGRMAQHNDVLATRATKEMSEAVKRNFKNAQYNETARTITIKNETIIKNSKKNKKIKKIDDKNNMKNANSKKILIISAGTSDIPVAEEAAVTAEMAGNEVERLYDVGVAGIHRLLSHRKKIESADVLIVVAGMDGALPSVVSGLVDKPVIAVPTSVGYGASFRGIGPLLTMLNACSPGIVVVNIDNGFGAGYFAGMI